MPNEDLENKYANHNKLVVDPQGKLLFMDNCDGRPMKYEIVGFTEKGFFQLKRIKT